MARHDKHGHRAGGAESHKKPTPAAALSAEQEAEVTALLAEVPALADALRAAAPEGRAAVAARLAPVERASEPAQRAFATRLGDLRGPASHAAAEVANALGELATAHEVAREARRARIRLRSTGALPTLDLAPSSPAAAPAPPVVPDTPRLVEAHVSRNREEGELSLFLGWQEGEDPDYVRGNVIGLDFWEGGVVDFTMRPPMRRARFLEETVQDLRAKTSISTVPITWAQARRLVLEALEVNAWRGTEPDADYRRNQRWLTTRLLDVPESDEARAAVAEEDARATREGDRPYFDTELDPQELVATWLGMWSFGDYGGAYDLLADDHPLRRGAPRDEFVRQRRAWADEARPAGLRLTLVREQAQRAGALWVPGAAGVVAPGGRHELEAFWSLTSGESPLGGALEELPLATISSSVTGRRWFWTAYTLEREATSGAWRIARTRDEGAASQALTVEELQQRVTEARAAAERIIAAPPPDPRADGAADLLRELTGGLLTAMHYRDALSVRVPLDEALYHASIADAQVIRAYERAAALLERMRGRFPNEARTHFELGIQYYLVGMDTARAGDAGAEVLWLERAATALRQAIAIEPSAEHLQALGEILARQGYFNQAIEQLRAAIASDPTRASAHSDLADALMSSAGDGNLDAPVATSRLDRTAREQRVAEVARAALAELRESLRLDPNTPAAYTRMGAIFDILGQREDALLAFQEAVRHDPGDAEARYTLGTLYLQRSEPERALPELEQAAQLQPEQAAIRVGLAATYAALKRRREAERELDAVDALRPGLPQVAELRAELAKLGKAQ